MENNNAINLLGNVVTHPTINRKVRQTLISKLSSCKATSILVQFIPSLTPSTEKKLSGGADEGLPEGRVGTLCVLTKEDIRTNFFSSFRLASSRSFYRHLFSDMLPIPSCIFLCLSLHHLSTSKRRKIAQLQFKH